MTNKQPVGKRQTLEEIMDKCDNPDLWTPSQIICFISDYLDGSIGEELPEDANDISEKPKGLSKEVLEAMELLRLEIFMLDDDYVKNVDPRFLVSTCRSFRIKAQNLLNALDSQFNHKVRDKEVCLSGGDYTVETKYRKEGDKLVIEEINEIKANPIEKRVYEILERLTSIYYKEESLAGRNQHNSLLDRVERLEQIIGGKK